MFRNRILAMLPPGEETRVQQNVIRAKVVPGQVLQEPGQPLPDVFFLESGLASVLAPCGETSYVEVAQIGPEAMTGLPTLLGTDGTTFNTVTVQVPGEAYRMTTEALHKILASAPVMRSRLNNAFRIFFVEISQGSVCNSHHTVLNRLSRRILMASDKLHNRDLCFTHDLLAASLGVRRASISIALTLLADAGGIVQQRGHIVIQDRNKLEAETCACYFRLRDFAKASTQSVID